MKHTTKNLAFLAFATSASSAVAAFAPITTATAPTVSGTPDTKFLQSFNVAGSLTAIPAASVVKGTTTAPPSTATVTARMDDFDLNTVASGFSATIKTVAFGSANFTDYNGSQPDFFLFEAGANPDTISIAAILPGGALGATVNVPTGITASSWGDTGLLTTANANTNTNQRITGICWDITDLKGVDNLPLPANSTIEGVAIISGFGIDPVGFYAVAPPSGISRFAVTASSPHPVGEGFDVTITAQTSGGATVNDSTTTVSIGSSTAGSLMEFDWDYNGTYGDSSGILINGSRIIRARNFKAQTVSLVATAGGTTTLSPPDVITIAGAYTKLQILAPGETTAIGTTATGKTGTPSIRSLNSPFDVTVNAVDQYWNPVVTSNTVSFSSTDGTATLPLPAAPLVNGLYSITLNAAGAFTATVTDDTDGNKTASTTGVMTALGAPITWVGTENDKWDTTSVNWTNSVAAAVPFVETDQVTFSQNGVSSVNIDGPVTPSLVTVSSNNTINYIFAGSGSIAGAVGGFNKSGTSTLTVSTANTYTGKTTVSGGVLLLDNATALPSASPLVLNSGILGLKSGGFIRAIGTAAGQVTIGTTNGAPQTGFAAFGANRIVNLGGASAPLVWGVDNFFTLVNTFALGSSESDFTVDFQNPINLGTTTRIFFVDGLADVDAILSGAITGGATFTKNGPGALKLSNSGNAYTGATIVNEGTLLLGASEVLPSGNNTVVRRTNTSNGSEVYLDINGFNEIIGTLELADEGSSSSSTNANQEPSIINTATGLGAAAILQVNGTITYLEGTGGINGQATISANLSTGTGIRTIKVGDSVNPTEDLVISGNLTGESINKTGLGTLGISTPRNTGNTTVTAGTLILRSANPNNDASTVTVAATTTLNLDYTGTDIVNMLIINGVTLADGVYGNTTPQITGSGTITVASDPYANWAGVGVPFTGDANNDVVQNGLAWFLGAPNKDANAAGLLPKPSQTAGGLVLEFDCLDAVGRGTAVFEVQYSNDLGLLDAWLGTVVPGCATTIKAGRRRQLKLPSWDGGFWR